MLNRFLFFCIIICLLTFIRINAQSKKISGYIKDRKTNEYIQFATIYEVNNKKGITSDINGYFELNLKKYDSLIIEVSHLNYDKLTTNFIILHDTTVTFYMQEKNIELNEVVVSSSYRIKDENTSFTRIF